MKGCSLIRLQCLLIISMMVITPTVHAQLVIKGRIKPGKNWENKLYLSVLNDFSKNFLTIDTIIPGPDGSFDFQRPVNDTNILYRLLLPPKKGNQHSMVEGFADNYVYLLVQNGASYELEADADSLFYSAVTGGNRNTFAINKLKELKRPFYQLAINTVAERARFTDSLTTINKRMMEAWRMASEKYRQDLKEFLLMEEDEGLMLLGLYYYYLADFGRYDSALFKQVTDRFEDGRSKFHLYSTVRSRIEQIEIIRVGKKLPVVKLKDLKEQTISSDQIKGGLVVIDFWASWCNPCRKANTGYLREINNHLKQIDGSLIGISVDSDLEKWKGAIKTDKTSWPQYIDTGRGGLADLLNVYSFPTYLVLDEEQNVLYETNNEMELRSFIENFRH